MIRVKFIESLGRIPSGRKTILFVDNSQLLPVVLPHLCKVRVGSFFNTFTTVTSLNSLLKEWSGSVTVI
jgi:hypothetical protein